MVKEELKKPSRIRFLDILLILLVIYVAIASLYLFNAIKELNSISSDFTEREELITANILSCGTDINCVTIFDKRNYACKPELIPRCIESFCRCVK